MINQRLEKIEKLRNEYISNVATRDYIEKEVNALTENVEKKKEISMQLDNSLILLNEVSNKNRELAKFKLESIVTNALRYAFESNVEFKIDLSVKRGVPSAEFRIVKMINGKECSKNPSTSNGGGVVDIVSTALRYAYLMALDENLARIIVLDEPGKMVSEEVSTRYSEFVKDLSDTFNVQTIFITHKNELEGIADNVIEVINRDGMSIIS